MLRLRYKGDSYLVDFIKNKTYDGLYWHLLFKDLKTGIIYAWPNVFWYEEGWTQGWQRSQRQYFLQTKGYGGVSQGSGQSSQSTPNFIDDQILYIVKQWKGEHFDDGATDFYQNEVEEFPKGTKKADIVKALNY